MLATTTSTNKQLIADFTSIYNATKTAWTKQIKLQSLNHDSKLFMDFLIQLASLTGEPSITLIASELDIIQDCFIPVHLIPEQLTGEAVSYDNLVSFFMSKAHGVFTFIRDQDRSATVVLGEVNPGKNTQSIHLVITWTVADKEFVEDRLVDKGPINAKMIDVKVDIPLYTREDAVKAQKEVSKLFIEKDNIGQLLWKFVALRNYFNDEIIEFDFGVETLRPTEQFYHQLETVYAIDRVANTVHNSAITLGYKPLDAAFLARSVTTSLLTLATSNKGTQTLDVGVTAKLFHTALDDDYDIPTNPQLVSTYLPEPKAE